MLLSLLLYLDYMTNFISTIFNLVFWQKEQKSLKNNWIKNKVEKMNIKEKITLLKISVYIIIVKIYYQFLKKRIK